eukprot:TRINITY_DN171_c0_g1_i1.p3 TRINITY_DN171_c0_g1~~TRINITY_DN171_c0_g1_i1.p3  ORF type:complete len:104 (-),score=20.28 TRINITY_DN171_c0_g1_i1:496-807(-)
MAGSVEQLKARLHHAVDLKDATERHIHNNDSDDYKLREELYEIDHDEMDAEMQAEHPSKEKLAKLLEQRDKMHAAGIHIAPEEKVWREEIDEVAHSGPVSEQG